MTDDQQALFDALGRVGKNLRFVEGTRADAALLDLVEVVRIARRIFKEPDLDRPGGIFLNAITKLPRQP